MNIAIIGGGATGFFSAITVKENYPNAEVFIFEKSNKLLSKIKISGGGRSNNIDVIPGGYNLQTAWTTAFIAGKLI